MGEVCVVSCEKQMTTTQHMHTQKPHTLKHTHLRDIVQSRSVHKGIRGQVFSPYIAIV